MTIAIIVILMSIQTFADEARTEQACVCLTMESVTECILKHVGNRENYFSVSVPCYLPQAELDCGKLLFDSLDQDSGFIRWGFEDAIATSVKEGANITYKYWMNYRTTLEYDNAAKNIASQITEKWNVEGLSDLQKLDMLKSYISANWRYDDLHKNIFAYPTLSEQKGSCLGLTMASQLILNNIDVNSRTVYGTLNDSGVPHILLLVKLDNLWCTFDPTELAREYPGTSAYLKNYYADYFTPDTMYLEESFRKSYPMTENDVSVFQDESEAH